MKAKDIMSSPVITVETNTPVREIAELLLRRHISGVPVVIDGCVVGMVNEGDLLRRYEVGTDAAAPPQSLWERLFGGDHFPADYVKSHGCKARDIMSRDVVSVSEDTTVQQLASTFDALHIRRLPVLRDGDLVGIVTRADLVRALALKAREREAPGEQSDEAIRVRLLRELEGQRWWQSDWSTLYVVNGIVHYRGLVNTDSERQAARVAAENVPGVRGVDDKRTSGVASMF